MVAMQIRIFKNREDADTFAASVNGVVNEMIRLDNETLEPTDDISYSVDFDFQ